MDYHYLSLISKLIEHLAWPLAVIVIVCILKNPITILINKLKSVAIKDYKFDLSDQPIQKPKDPTPQSINIPIPTDSLGLVDEYKQLILNDLGKAIIKSEEDKINILVSHLAATQLKLVYQNINCSIFGSQIELLRWLNSMVNPVDVSRIKVFYDIAAEKYPDVYQKYTFQEYLSYLTNIKVLEIIGSEYRISKLGKGYLIYIDEFGFNSLRNS